MTNTSENSNNFLQVGKGHCFVCHEDFEGEEIIRHYTHCAKHPATNSPCQKCAGTKCPAPRENEWEKEFYRLINPYRDVLDDSSVETLKARIETLISQAEQRGAEREKKKRGKN